ncbi:MAG: hypothetical protein HUK14_08855 [Muribaculaceae bacterium]|nr:hypothetical protein [Muribaculaceae bacterium]
MANFSATFLIFFCYFKQKQYLCIKFSPTYYFFPHFSRVKGLEIALCDIPLAKDDAPQPGGKHFFLERQTQKGQKPDPTKFFLTTIPLQKFIILIKTIYNT